MKNWIFILLSVGLLYSCSGGKRTKTFKLENVEFVYSGPIFEGSNPAQYVASIDLKSILKEDYTEGVEVDNASLKSALVRPSEADNFSEINALVLSLACDNPDLQMQELAVVNPIPKGSKKVKLKPSPTADATYFFGEKKIYVVLDASFSKDVDRNVVLLGSFEFELTY
ncbi:MAG: hypothetical protein ACK50Y_01610 [Flavobacteriia bacterium]